MNKINDLIDEHINEFIRIISNEYNISYNNLKNKWLEFIDLTLKEEKDTEKNKENNIDSIKKDTDSIEKNKENNIEKKKKDTDSIEKKKKDTDSIEKKKKKDTDSIEKKKKDTEKKEKKIIKSIEESENESEEEFVVRKKPQEKIYSGIIIRLNKIIKKYVHKDSGMVFYSKDELVVYAKLINNRLFKLTDDDKDICKKLKFRIDPSLYNEDDENYVYSDIKNDINNNDKESFN
jgi:hypothetical protein